MVIGVPRFPVAGVRSGRGTTQVDIHRVAASRIKRPHWCGRKVHGRRHELYHRGTVDDHRLGCALAHRVGATPSYSNRLYRSTNRVVFWSTKGNSPPIRRARTQPESTSTTLIRRRGEWRLSLSSQVCPTSIFSIHPRL